VIRRALFVTVVALITPATFANPTKSASRGTMTEVIETMCAFLMEREQTASSAAQRFGMHLHDEGGAGVTFTPRDRRFSQGSVGREWKKPSLNALGLIVAKEATLTVGELRARFGRFKRIDGEHYDDPPEWTATYSRPDRALRCDVTFQLAVGFLDGEPTDELKIKRVTLIPQPKG
jgi:hypothetical protein